MDAKQPKQLSFRAKFKSHAPYPYPIPSVGPTLYLYSSLRLTGGFARGGGMCDLLIPWRLR